jgi:MYXO-CTERM domain-containing protein
MSVKYLNLKLGIFTLGLVVAIALLAVLSANEQVSAATPLDACDRSATGQDQACINNMVNTKEVKADVTAWAAPASTAGKALGEKKLTSTEVNKTATRERDLSTGGLPPEAMILFAMALGGIVFLRRRRKMAVRKD